jgi:hypothetical protein
MSRTRIASVKVSGKPEEQFELWWANFDPDHRYGPQAKRFVFDVWLIVRQSNLAHHPSVNEYLNHHPDLAN